MRQQPVTRPQVSGYRFHLRRLENAVVRRDVRGLSDPLRSHGRALVVGVVLAAVVLAGSAIFGLVRPKSHLGDVPIAMTKDSGAMFVRIGGTMHPVLNLASARLIVEQPAKPVLVSQKALADLPRGPLVGIPGAPSAMPYDTDSTGRSWSVCDASEGGRLQYTTLVADDPDGLEELTDNEALLVKSGEQTYLVHAGHRSVIDTEDGAVRHALSVDDEAARQVSSALLAAIPETSEIASPEIPGAGEPGPGSLRDYEVGTIVQVGEDRAVRHYVVLTTGVQQISPFTAELIRFTDSHGQPSIPVLPPDALRAVDVVKELDVASFPESAPTIVEHATECLMWEPVARDSSGSATTRVLIGPKLTGAGTAVELVQADGSGPNLDSVHLAAGTGVFAKAVQAQSSGQHGDSLHYVSDTGVRYGIEDAKTAAMLGLRAPEPVPWQMLNLLATGPGLTRQDARVVHDGMEPDSAGKAIEKSDG